MREFGRRSAVVVVLVLGLSGCGKYGYPVEGKVLWKEGAPATELAGGMVVVESLDSPFGASSQIGPDATFHLTTSKGRIVPAGRYRAWITGPGAAAPELPPPHIVATKYENPATSGLEFTVEAKPNNVVLTVERYRPNRP